MTPLSVLSLISKTAIVVPCYNESDRFSVSAFENFIQSDNLVRFIFVDDGSTDHTAALLDRLKTKNRASVDLLHLPTNCGKAEAIRQGFLAALSQRYEAIGFWDADLSTPLAPINDFRRVLNLNQSIEMVIGTRLSLLGRRIHRRPFRRFLGHLFSKASSLCLGLPIRDTQCGAKMFRVTPHLKRAVAKPFLAKWIFDVELIARYSQILNSSGIEGSFIYEQPLDQWHEVSGSRLQPADFLTAFIDLVRIFWRHRRPGAPPYFPMLHDQCDGNGVASEPHPGPKSRAA